MPITMAILYLCKGDVNQSMIEAASFGRDCDTTASMAGSIAGVMWGASAIRSDWIETLEEANWDLSEEVEGDPEANYYAMAQRMVELNLGLAGTTRPLCSRPASSWEKEARAMRPPA